MSYTQANLYFTIIPDASTSLTENSLLFKGMHGEERLSDFFFFNLEMLSESNALDIDNIIGKKLTLIIKFAENNQRYINGVVSKFSQSGGDSRFTIYHAQLRPWLWILTLGRNCRIFQNMTVPDIIKKIFNDAKQTDYRDELKGTYSEREYCVQYNESDFDFVARLMADEGIFFYFEHTQGTHTLIMADDLSVHTPCAGISEAKYLRAENTKSLEDAIVSCSLSKSLTTGKYEVGDFNFETPSLDLSCTAEGTYTDQSIYEYNPGYTETLDGEKIAKRRLTALEWNHTILEGKGHCFSFSAGYKFTLQEHPSANLNKEYILYQVSHSLSFNSYSNSFHAFPATVSFRPPIIPNKPRIYGTQTAIVTGKEGEEIWTDKYGRVKVQFHWDREGKKDENSSCWIRVNQSWAGKGWGNFWLPRIGQEVIVSYLNGDPDYPVITGAVYNAEQTLPYTLPDHQTRTTLKSRSTKEATGFNEMRFEDKVDEEEFYMHAQKDMNIEVLNDQSSTIKKNRTVTIEEGDDTLTISDGKRVSTIKKSRTTTVEEEDDVLNVEKGNRKETFKKNHEVTVEEGNRIIKVEKGSETHTVKGDYTIQVDGDLVFKVKGDISMSSSGSIKIEADGDIEIKAGGDLKAEAMNIENEGTLSIKNKTLELNNEATTISTKADTMNELKGLKVDINGDAMVSINGGIVMIN